MDILIQLPEGMALAMGSKFSRLNFRATGEAPVIKMISPGPTITLT